MKRVTIFFFLAGLVVSSQSFAQDDPIVMTIDGENISKSEFDYFYTKNLQDSDVHSESLDKYVNLFIDYKLKVAAAKKAGIDKNSSFIKEYKEYRNILAEDYLIDSTFLENTAKETFRKSQEEVGPDGIISLEAISIVPKGNTDKDIEESRLRIDSIFGLLVQGANFNQVAATYSDDATAKNGGQSGWVSKQQLSPDMADKAFSLKVGEMTSPFLCDAGYVILRVTGKQSFGNYDDHRNSIYEWMKNQGLYDESKKVKAERLSKNLGWNLYGDDAIAREDSLLEELYPDFKNISREYHDGLLLFEISNREVWEKASKDSLALNKFFQTNRKNYKFEKPLFKGMLLFCINKQVYDDLENKLEGIPYEEWGGKISNINKDSEIVKVIRGIIEKGKNKYIDYYVFGEGNHLSIDGFPYVKYMGTVLEQPESIDEVKAQVVNDYQTYLNNIWIKNLRKKYKFKVNKKVLKTVNIPN